MKLYLLFALMGLVTAQSTTYSLGNKNQNACPSGKGKIMTKTECATAAKQWSLNMNTKTANWPTFPKGCLLFASEIKRIDKMFYFNIHTTGRGQESSQVVCKDVQMSMYAAGKTSSVACPQGYSTIMHIYQCTEAASKMGKKFVRAAIYPTVPKGCLQYNNDDFYFNSGRTGKASSLAKPICVKSGSVKTNAPTKATMAPSMSPTSSSTTFKDFSAWLDWCKADGDRCTRTTICGKEKKKGICKYTKNAKKIKCKRITDPAYCAKLRCEVKCKGKDCKKKVCTGKPFQN